MIVKARVNMLLSINSDEFPMPVDGDPTEELEDMIEDLAEHLDGATLVRLNIKCTGGQIHD